jgi:hypothetical protein
MMKTRQTMKKPLELTIGRMGHVGFIIPWVYHFLSRLRLLLARAQNKRTISINKKCARDLELMQGILDKAKQGIDMNLFAFRLPDCIYYSDSCPAGLGKYSNQEHTWLFKVPENLQFRASNNLLKFLAAIITPWIDIIDGCLGPGDCALSMTDSTTVEGWMKKSNFVKPNNNPIQTTACVDAARKHASIFMNADVKGYSQWFARKLNNVTDTLLRDWHCNEEELTYIICSHFPEQMLENFHMSPLPSKIDSLLTSVLRQLPVSKQLREQHTTMGLELGSGGGNIDSLSDATTFISTGSVRSREISCWELLPWLSGKAGSRKIALNHWLKAQSEVPSHMWYRPFRNWPNRTPLRTQTTCLASFYHNNSGPIAMTIPSRCNKRPCHMLSLMN